MSSALRNDSLDVPIYGVGGVRRALTARRWCNWQATGIDCPRNSGDQYDWAISKAEIVTAQNPSRRSGVLARPCRALQVSDSLHANAHHHAVAVEATADAFMRDAASKAEAIILRLALRPSAETAAP